MPSDLSGRERALLALERKQPDRVPIFELMPDPGIMAQAVRSGSYADFAELVGLDCVLTGTPSRLYEEKVLDPQRRIVVNEWGMKRQYTDAAVSMPLEGPIQAPSDLDSYQPPDPMHPRRYEQLQMLLQRFKGRKLVGMHLHDVFSYPTYLRGMEEFLIDLIDKPELAHRLVDLSVEHNIAVAEQAVRLGCDFILLGDDYAATTDSIFSPEHFREFMQPGLRRIVEAVHAAGAWVIKHTDGHIEKLLDMIVSAGVDGLHPLQAEAGMDMADVKRRYGDRICVIGGADCSQALCSHSVEQFTDEVLDALRQYAPGGVYMIATSNTLHRGCRLANYLAMADTVRRHGRYPIDIPDAPSRPRE